ICGALRLVPEDQDDFVFHVNGEAAEHRARVWRQRGDRVEHELVRNRFALLERKTGTCRWRVSARLRHRKYDIARTRPKQRQALVEAAKLVRGVAYRWHEQKTARAAPRGERGRAALLREARSALGSCVPCQAAESALIVT